MARKKKRASFAEIEDKFQRTAFRLNQERSDFLLPQILDFVTSKKWINLRPEYQRRLVWDINKRSLFIESLLLNIPIPSLFLYERELSRYEVMDGQQRLNAVVDFLENRYELKGLEKWEELNGFRYEDLPETLQRGLARRRLSATVLLVEPNSATEQQENDIRKMVFERLNTGGQDLNNQELRNCLHSGPYNEMIIRCARNADFTTAWEIPRYDENVDRNNKLSAELSNHKLYRRMQDCEIVLRFFAFREKGNIKGSVRSMLDRCMEMNVKCTEAEAAVLENDFVERIRFCRRLFGNSVFRYPDKNGDLKLSQPLYDATMVAIDRLWDYRNQVLAAKERVRSLISTLLGRKPTFDIIIGKPNTSTAVKQRIDLLEGAIKRAAKVD